MDNSSRCTCGAGNYEPLYKHERDCGLLKFQPEPISEVAESQPSLESAAREIAEVVANDVYNLTPQRIEHFVPLISKVLERHLHSAAPKNDKDLPTG